MNDKRPPRRLQDFPVTVMDTIRYGDTDMLGHVNNAVFSTFLETGRAQLLFDPARPVWGDASSFVLARLAMDFRAEITWPGQIHIGTGVLSIGRSSLTLAQALFQNDTCCATAETVVVMFDTTTRRARPIPEESRAVLEGLMLA